jgi:alpha-L-fucosidase
MNKGFFRGLLIAVVAVMAGACGTGRAPEALGPVPSPSQLDWQQDEICAFIHFGPNTFSDSEWGYGDADPSIFNPTKLDCEQWVRTFEAAGIKGVILTAKHHDGFCMWPSEYTDYSVAASPYKGDIVGELAEACKRHGLKFGVYLSPWDRHQASYGTAEYTEYYHNQLRELMTKYGTISEVWLDGANGGDGWYGGACETRNIDRRTYYDFPKIHSIVNELQPGAIIFSDGGPGCRWVGNERGIASETNWSFLKDGVVYPGYPHAEELGPGHADGDVWIPAECDVSIRRGWFYHPEEDTSVKTPEQLVDLYYRSVGRNGKLLINFPVDREGLIHPTDSANICEARKTINRELGDNLLAGAKVRASETRGRRFAASRVLDASPDTFWAPKDDTCEGTLEFTFREPQSISRVLLQEQIALGQRVQGFTVEYYDGTAWHPIPTSEQTTTIGYKRILRFEPVAASALRLTITASRACPCISSVQAFR